MFGIGIFGWVALGLLLIGAGIVALHFRPATGRHAIRSARRIVDEPTIFNDLEETVILRPLFGNSDVISGYVVGDVDDWEENSLGPVPSRIRPYLLHLWALRGDDPEQTVDLSWTDDEPEGEEDDELPAFAFAA